jgi:hypothetical protein
MEFSQKFGAAILFIIPTFVGAGLWYDVFGGSYLAAILWILLMPPAYVALIARR